MGTGARAVATNHLSPHGRDVHSAREAPWDLSMQ
jgi:hypothetical protein